ncbi:platelet-activating factor acetylhydrolase, partial [Cercophora samala]
SLLSSLFNPVPGFPEYTGPYKVGTVDVEIPISELPTSQQPEGAADVHTVLFRIFYPATPEAHGKNITWLPAPQRLHIEAYAQFLGLGSKAASVLSFLPRHLHWTTIPAIKNAALLSPPAELSNSRWPTMIFSHGLGGNRNAYSHLAGSLASHGVVVICPEHRDQSAALTLIRDPQNPQNANPLPYLRIPHNQTPEIWAQRDSQLRIRLWELDLIFEAILAIDRNDNKIIASNLNTSTPASALSAFSNKLDILDPGKVIFAGHSFGSSTMVQFLKSVFYSSHPSLESFKDRLFTPRPSSAITSQINGTNPTILLDMWCFPLLSAASDRLYHLPLPCYSVPQQQRGETSKILAVESDQFFKWGTHLHRTARILSADPTAEVVGGNGEHPAPYLFYVEKSAHLSQSDFAVLFPWLTKKAFGSETPEVVLSLNVRAVVQFLRGEGVVV